MNKYRAKIKKRMIFQLIGALALIPAAVYTFIKYLYADGIISGTPARDFLGGMFNGIRSSIVAGFVIYLIIMFFRSLAALKTQEKLTAMSVFENDERYKAICEASSRVTYNITIYAVMAACLLSGLFSSAISLTLLVTWVFIVIVRVVTTYIYNSKM